MNRRPLYLCLVTLALGAMLFGSRSSHAQVPIEFTLNAPGYVTLVADSISAAGDTTRVRNLIQEEYFSEGTHTIYWDGYDFGEIVTTANGTNGTEFERSVIHTRDYLIQGIVHSGIEERYEFDVYSNKASPSWKTSAKDGAWLSDHSTPFTAEFIVEGDGSPRIYIGSITAEEGHRGISTTLDGEKIYGDTDFGNSVAGPIAFAQDANSTSGRVAALQVWDDDDGFRWEVPLLIGGDNYLTGFRWRLRTRNQSGSQGAKNQLFDIVRWNDTGIFSATAEGLLVFIDLSASPGGTEYSDRTQSPSYIGEIAGLDAPRGLAFENDSTLLVVDNTTLERWSIDRSAGTGTLQETLITGLDEPQDVEVANDGSIYVSLHGSTDQIWVFDASGQKVREIGESGGARLGAYDERRMNRPRGFTIVEGLPSEYSSYNNRLYVAEESFSPKRVSVWTTQGDFIDGWYGSPKYAGGGEIMTSDKSRYFYSSGAGTFEFSLNWTTGESNLRRILMLPSYDLVTESENDNEDTNFIGQFPRRYAPQTPVEQNGQLYLHDSFSATENNPISLNTIWMYDPALERLKMTTVFGIVGWGDEADWSIMNEEPVYSDWRGIDEGHRVMFNWTDADGDEQAEASEFTFAATPDIRTRLYIDNELNIMTSDGRQFTPTFDSDDRPVYDPAQNNVRVDVRGQNNFRFYDWGDGTGALIPTGRGFVQDAGPVVGYTPEGQIRWRYHNQWPTNNSGTYAPIPQYSGHLVRMGSLLTPKVFTPADGEAGPIWGLNGYHGSMHMFTHDGLYLAELGADKRVAQRYGASSEQRNADISGYTPSDEHYWPTLQKTDDGNVYLVLGKESSRIHRIEGLETVDRLLPWTITVTDEMLSGLDSTQYTDDSYAERPSGTASTVTDLILDGSAAEWSDATWLPIDENRNWEAAVAYTSTDLFAVWKTGTSQLLQYAGGTLNRMFADGGSLEISLGVNETTITENDRHRERDGQVWHEPIAGDRRIIITREGDPETGTLRAMLYEQVSNNPLNTTTYESPIRTLTLDRVEEISDQVEIAHAGGTYEVKINLDAIGFSPDSGDETVFEIGVIEGTPFEATRRVYWGNKTELHTSDVPSEAEVLPYRWGDLTWEGASSESSNEPPSVTLSGVSDGSVQYVPVSVDLTVSASDPDGSVQRLVLLENGESIEEATSASATFTWAPTTTGTYRLAAYAFDGNGARGHTPSRTVFVYDTQSLTLHQGWNLISSHLSPSSDSMANLFSSVDDVLGIVQDQAGNAYDPDQVENTLITWSPSKGYRVYMNAERTLTIEGTVVSSRLIELDRGWNLIPFYPSSEMAVEDAFSSLGDALEIVKDEEGQSYIPERGFNEIGTLKPGRAYKVYVNTSTSFSYP